MSKNHLLIIDDDKKLRQLLDQYLTRCGFFVNEVENPEQAEKALDLFSFDAIIMDVMMPVQNGIAYTQILRKRGIKTPILMLTAMGDTLSRISGLEAGADDYLAKPFEPKELLLRLNNLLKHSPVVDEATFGPFHYANEQLTKLGKHIKLTTAENNLLKIFIKFANQSVSREELARQTQSKSLRTIDVQVARLRQKIENEPKKPLFIQSIRGKGYKLICP